ncbi:beta-N-acetylhexosaminidase [Vibrio ostreicida]|uniref:beta-N-acetylhexosaminidase n=1 Tax=Vibrio ostreicida TaxID=526588 RepID=UPI003B5CF697
MDFRVDLAVLSESNQSTRLGLTLYNLSEEELSEWTLLLILDQTIVPESVNHGRLAQVGSFCTLDPNCNTLAVNDHFYCEFDIQPRPIRFHSDGIREAVIKQANINNMLAVTISPMTPMPEFKTASDLCDSPLPKTALIPLPSMISHQTGHFHLSSRSQIKLDSSQATSASLWLNHELQCRFGYQFTTNGENDLVFFANEKLDVDQYKITVSKTGIRVEANSPSGFIHASATLLQLFQPGHRTHRLCIPYVHIMDAPRFKYRGMMLDCARHFHSVLSIKRLINQLASYKFNVFHWHLTDDEGWRLEINAFPQLTQIGAYRGHSTSLEPQFSHLSCVYGGYYTQAQVLDIIDYANQRGVAIIPEIDIPSHCRAAIRSLPDLLVDTNDTSSYLSVQHYSDNVLSPALAGTYQFLDRVLEEVATLFPAPWIHIGADEIPDGVWLNSPSCQTLMRSKGYRSTKDLQGHLFRYIEEKLHSLGKRMLGWEEVRLGGKISKKTVLYSWSNEEAALKSAKQGFDVVLQPARFTYLDMVQDEAPQEPGMHWAGVISLEKAYGYEPLANIKDDDPIHQHVWGVQCALWSEHVIHQQQLDYMIFPRLSALAEVCWTQKKLRNWQDYRSRLIAHLPNLDQQNIGYRHP